MYYLQGRVLRLRRQLELRSNGVQHPPPGHEIELESVEQLRFG